MYSGKVNTLSPLIGACVVCTVTSHHRYVKPVGSALHTVPVLKSATVKVKNLQQQNGDLGMETTGRMSLQKKSS